MLSVSVRVFAKTGVFVFEFELIGEGDTESVVHQTEPPSMVMLPPETL